MKKSALLYYGGEYSVDHFPLLAEYVNDKSLNIYEIVYLSAYKQFGSEDADAILKKVASIATYRRVKKHLISIGYIEKKKPKDVFAIKEKTIELSHKGNKCEWCGQECYTLHEHHFPIPKHKGGTETVRICPNCHYTFHALMGGNRSI